MAFEDGFGIEIPDEDAEKIQTSRTPSTTSRKRPARTRIPLWTGGRPASLPFFYLQEERPLKRRVVVTGIGIVSAVGTGTEKAWRTCWPARAAGPHHALRRQDYPVTFAGEVKDFNPEDFIEKKEVRKYDRFIHFALAASEFAVQMAGLPGARGWTGAGRRVHRLGHRRLRHHRAEHSKLVDRRPPQGLALLHPGVHRQPGRRPGLHQHGAQGAQRGLLHGLRHRPRTPSATPSGSSSAATPTS